MRIGQVIDVVLAVIIACGAAIALAQSGADEKRGSVPPGTSRDGSKPADGAIVGGAIDAAEPAAEGPRKEVERCKQLTGTLREGCLRDLREQGRLPRASDQARSRNETPPRSVQ